MFWVYGPDKKDITIIGLEPHPEDAKNGAYDRINEYYGAAEPLVRCGESHLSGLTEPLRSLV